MQDAMGPKRVRMIAGCRGENLEAGSDAGDDDDEDCGKTPETANGVAKSQ